MRSKAAKPNSRHSPAASETAARSRSARHPLRNLRRKSRTAARRGKGLAIDRFVTRRGQTAAQVLDEVTWTHRPAKISGADGEVVFKMDDAEVPEGWSQLATDVAVSKYFRKAGVPTKSGAEESARMLVKRVAHTLRTAGEEQGGYFATAEDAESFEAELTHYLVNQMGAFNSPVWFNLGLFHEYKIKGSGGNYAGRSADRLGLRDPQTASPGRKSPPASSRAAPTITIRSSS